MSPTRKLPLAALAILILSAAVIFGFAETVSAQCAMCRTALEQDGGRLAVGFNRAILFLLGMPYLIFASIAGSWYWKRRKAGGGLGSSVPAK